MLFSSRESAFGALSTLLATSYDWNTGPIRRLRLWADVPVANRPACFIYEGGYDSYSWGSGVLAKRTLEARIFVYLDAKDPNIVGASRLNDVMDALDAAFEPVGADVPTGRQTLGGRVHDCRIDGKIMKDPGDLDGDALLIVPVKIVLP